MSTSAFSNDLFDRKNIAERILFNFSTQNPSTVILIDAPWGDGKTYFGESFFNLLDLEHNSFPIYIDAFEPDFVDDPFIMLSSTLHKLSKKILNSEKQQNFLKNHSALLKN